jgi:hypothetical protein
LLYFVSRGIEFLKKAGSEILLHTDDRKGRGEERGAGGGGGEEKNFQKEFLCGTFNLQETG